jgi:toxin CcdB
MSQYTVYRNPDGVGYLLNVQANVNDHYATRVVVPMFTMDSVKDFANTLNPVFEIDGVQVVMMTQGLAAVPTKLLKQPVTSLEDRRADIVSALDLLFHGF